MITPKYFTVYKEAIAGFSKTLSDQRVDVSITQDESFNFSDTSSFKVHHQIEPPEVTDVIDKLIDNHTFYDLILSWHTRVLNACPNARLFPLGCCSWIPWNDAGANFNHAKPSNGRSHTECDASKKQFKVSYLTSYKNWTPGHILRQHVYDVLPGTVGDLQIDKHKSPPWIADKRDMLEGYQFVISPLNASHDNWIDDKMIDPLISKTIPLIWGCPNMETFFNMEGIIRFNDSSDLLSKLASLTPDYYEKHYDAVMDNYTRAMKLTPVWTRVDKEITDGIDRKFPR